MSKKVVRADAIGSWFNQLKHGISDADHIKKLADYSGYFLYDSEAEKLFNEPDGLSSIHVETIDAEAFRNFLTEFDLVKTPKYRKQAGDKTSRVSLNSAESALEKGVAPENVQLFIENMTKMYEFKKEAEKYLNGKKIAVSIPERKEKEEQPANDGAIPPEV